MNAPSSARSSKRSLRGRDTRQGTQFGRRGVGTGLGVSSAGDTNSWLWPASRASKSSNAIGPTGLFEGGAALKPARARAAMPKRGLAQAFPVSLLPKALPFASTTRALPETGPGAPKRLRAGSRAALVRRMRPRRGPLLDATPTCRFAAERARSAAKRMRRRLSRAEAPFILSWGAAHTGPPQMPPRTSARAIPGAAPLRHGVRGRSGKRASAPIFVRLGGFLPSAGGEAQRQRPAQNSHTRAGCTVATGWYALLCCPGDAGQRRACR